MFDTGTIVPIAFLVTVAFMLVSVTTIISDGRTRRRLIEAGAASVGLALILIQFLPYRSDQPIVLGVIFVFAGAGLLAYYASARRLARPT